MEARWKNTIFANGSNSRILFCEAQDFHTHLAQLHEAPVSQVKSNISPMCTRYFIWKFI